MILSFCCLVSQVQGTAKTSSEGSFYDSLSLFHFRNLDLTAETNTFTLMVVYDCTLYNHYQTLCTNLMDCKKLLHVAKLQQFRNAIFK